MEQPKTMTDKPIVKIYSTPSCRYCSDAKDYFVLKGINYEDINLVGNLEKIVEVKKISGGSSVPVITINDTVIVGFDKEKINAALSISE